MLFPRSDTSLHGRHQIRILGSESTVKARNAWASPKKSTNSKPKSSSSPKSPDDFAIPGVKNAFDNSQPIIIRVIWLLAVLACIALTVYQVVDRIILFKSDPITVEVTLVVNETLKFPSVLVCPIEGALLHPKFQEMTEEELMQDYSEIDVWKVRQIKKSKVAIEISCGKLPDKQNNNCSYRITTRPVESYWGRCLLITVGNPVKYKSPDTSVKIKLLEPFEPFNVSFTTNKTYDEESAFSFYYFGDQSRPRHLIYYAAQKVSQGIWTVASFTLQEFQYLNRSNQPCEDDVGYQLCIDRCLERFVKNVSACILPFYDTGDPCKTIKDAINSIENIRKQYDISDPSSCSCQRQCIRPFYGMTITPMRKLMDNSTVLEIQFQTNIIQTVKEYRAYPIEALLSDIGGSVGLFLGCCVLTILEMMQSCVGKITSLI